MFTNIFGRNKDRADKPYKQYANDYEEYMDRADKPYKQYANDYEEYMDMKRGTFARYDKPLVAFIPANEICGIFDRNNRHFWNHHSNCKDDYINLTKLMNVGDARATENFYSPPIKVYKFKSIYILGSDGRHRVCAAQELKIAIKVLIAGVYEKIE